MRTSARTRYAGYRFPAEIIGHAVWLYFRFPLGLRIVEALLAVRGIIVSAPELPEVRRALTRFRGARRRSERRCRPCRRGERDPDKVPGATSARRAVRNRHRRCAVSAPAGWKNWIGRRTPDA